jgi:hypothetical protein
MTPGRELSISIAIVTAAWLMAALIPLSCAGGGAGGAVERSVTGEATPEAPAETPTEALVPTAAADSVLRTSTRNLHVLRKPI